MTDTVRTTAALLALLADSAASRSTNRQLLRDVVASFDVSRRSQINIWEYPQSVVSGADWTSYITQAVSDANGMFGATIVFPLPCVYGMSSQVLVDSIYPISLVSTMGAFSNSPNGSYFKPLNNITGSLFKYSHAANRSRAGGGLVSGLSFADSSSRAFTISGAALDLTDFLFSSCEYCHFEQLLGSAIRTEFAVMSSVLSPRIRICGNTSQPAFNVQSAVGGFATQSFTIFDMRSEVNYAAPYLQIDVNGSNIKLIGGGFEADTLTAATCQQFVKDLGRLNIYSGTHFNRNTVTNVVQTGGDSPVTGCTFASHSGTSLQPAGANAITGNTFYNNVGQTYAIDFSGGTNNAVAGNVFASSGTITGTGDFTHTNTIGRNVGLTTEAKGAATVANGNTTIVVTHGLVGTPALQDISVTPTNNLGAATKFWISTVTATQFTINVDVSPGATTATFAWTARLG